MQRLRDQRGSSDPVVKRAAELLSARKPLAADAERKLRVRARLRRRRPSPAGAMVVRWAILIVVTCSVAAASAMIGKVATAIRVLRAEKREEAAHEQRTRRRIRTHVAVPTPVTVPTVPTVPTPASPPRVLSPPPLPSTPAPAIARPSATGAVARSAPLDAQSEEQLLLVSAVRALRHERDPARATELLGRYLERYPDGVAVEDALALAMEATIARDPARAAGFATRYLAHYPAGRWSALARRALEP